MLLLILFSFPAYDRLWYDSLTRSRHVADIEFGAINVFASCFHRLNIGARPLAIVLRA